MINDSIYFSDNLSILKELDSESIDIMKNKTFYGVSGIEWR